MYDRCMELIKILVEEFLFNVLMFIHVVPPRRQTIEMGKRGFIRIPSHIPEPGATTEYFLWIPKMIRNDKSSNAVLNGTDRRSRASSALAKMPQSFINSTS